MRPTARQRAEALVEAIETATHEGRKGFVLLSVDHVAHILDGYDKALLADVEEFIRDEAEKFDESEAAAIIVAVDVTLDFMMADRAHEETPK